MAPHDQDQYKHLPKFGYFIYNCHFPNKSVNHSKTPYVSLRTIKMTTISFNTIVPSDFLATPILITSVHFPIFSMSLIYTRQLRIIYLTLIRHPLSNAVKLIKPPYNNLDHLNRYNQQYVTIGTLMSRLDPFIHVWFSVSHRTPHRSFTKHQSPKKEA